MDAKTIKNALRVTTGVAMNDEGNLVSGIDGQARRMALTIRFMHRATGDKALTTRFGVATQRGERSNSGLQGVKFGRETARIRV